MHVFIMTIITILLLAMFSIPDIPTEHISFVLYTLIFIGVSIWLAISFMMTPLGTIHLTRFFLENRELDVDLINIRLTTVPKNRFIDRLIFKPHNLGLLIIATIIASGLLSYGLLLEFENQKYDVKITSHRGNVMYAPENTIAALEMAAKNGAHYAEIDIQQTSDGELVLLHDSSLKRTTGEKSNVWDYHFVK